MYVYLKFNLVQSKKKRRKQQKQQKQNSNVSLFYICITTNCKPAQLKYIFESNISSNTHNAVLRTA